MFISHKSNIIQHISQMDWECRLKTKDIKSVKAYWDWVETIKDSDGVPDYSGESGYTIVECTDEDVQERLVQLDDYIDKKPEKITYNIKYYASKRDAEEILDNDGKSHDPKQYVQSHFVGDDTAKDKRILDQKWADIRTKRNRLLTESDWVVVKAKETHANASIPSDWVDYRTELRDITKQSDPDDITWPTKP